MQPTNLCWVDAKQGITRIYFFLYVTQKMPRSRIYRISKWNYSCARRYKVITALQAKMYETRNVAC